MIKRLLFIVISLFILTSLDAHALSKKDQQKLLEQQEPNLDVLPKKDLQTSSLSVNSSDDKNKPFGASLFSTQAPSGSKEPMNPNYQIVPGDQIDIQAWGAVSYNSTTTVDNQGNIFLPEVGPIHVQGVTQSALNSVVKQKVNQVYKDNVQVYTALRGSLPISVFVTGAVKSPGRYVGTSTDSIIDYIYKAGGIDAERGSYRNIIIMRNSSPVEEFDIYDFLINGATPSFQVKESDTILVKERGEVVAVKGDVKNPFQFEFVTSDIQGSDVIKFASPHPDVTNVKLSGTREGKPFKSYVSLDKFSTLTLLDGDEVEFSAGNHEDMIEVKVSGRHKGPKTMVVPIDARLIEVLNNVPVDKNLSNIDSVYIKRKSVAAKQKEAIDDSLKRLEETLLLSRASGATPSETSPISVAEAGILEKFVEKAKSVEPEGKVVVTNENGINNIALEDGDEIVIPQKTDLVMVNGEVLMPKAIVWAEGDDVSDYIEKAGGFTDRANETEVVVVKSNGETVLDTSAEINPGDEIMVLPEVKINNLELTSKVVEILYKVAIAAAVPFRL